MTFTHSINSIPMRILASLLLLLSILFFPIWVSIPIAVVSMIYFNIFLEAIFLFLLSDLLFGVKEVRFFDITFISFIFSAIFLFLLEIFKRKLKFYN